MDPMLDAMIHKRSSHSSSPTLPSSVPVEAEFMLLAVCLDKVHIKARWWMVLLSISGVEGYNVFSWRRFHIPRFE